MATLTPALKTAIQKQDTNAAARLAREEAARFPNDPTVLHFAAYHSIQNDELDLALPLLLRAQQLAPEAADILNSLANLRRRRGETTEALALFHLILRDHPADCVARFNLARMLEDMGDDDSAKLQYQAILAHEPSDAQAIARLFYLHAASGAYDEALAYGLRISSDRGYVYAQLSTRALVRADFAAARRFGEQAVAACPSPSTILPLAHAEFRDGDPEQAQNVFRR